MDIIDACETRRSVVVFGCPRPCWNLRRRQVHEVPEVFTTLFGVLYESKELIVPSDTTGTFDVSGAKRNG
jgi:hypothetical protein